MTRAAREAALTEPRTDRDSESSPPELGGLRRDAEARLAERLALGRPEAGDVQRLVHELGVHQIELEMQNEHLRHTQAELQAARDRYADLYERAPVGYLTFGLDGLVIDANRRAAALMGVAPAALRGRRFAEHVAAEDRRGFQQALTRLLRDAEPQVHELRLASRGGQPRWVAIELMLVLDPMTQAPQCRAALLDIGESVALREGLARLASIVATADAAIIGRDPVGVVTSWNAAAERLLCCPAGQAVGGTLERFVPPELAEQEAELLRRLRAGAGVAHLDTERLRADGSRVPVAMSLSPVVDDEGRVVGSSLFMRDVTDRRRAEQALHKQLRQLDLLSQAGQALIMGDGDVALGRHHELFDRVRGAVGAEIFLSYACERDALMLEAAHGLSEAQRAERGRMPMAGSMCGLVARKGAPVVLENLQAHRDMPEAVSMLALGATCYAGFPLRSQGRVAGVAAFASTRRRAFREGDLQVMQTVCDQVSAMLERAGLLDALQRREQSLRQADRAKDNFIATLAHELRNPLAPIGNALAILHQCRLHEPRAAWCRDVIERQVRQMSHLLEDLLDVSRVTRNKIELRSEPMDLVVAVQQALETTRPLIDALRHRLEVALPEAPLRVQGDVTRLTQVFANLLNNAAKYTDPGGAVAVSLQADGGVARFVVRDTGIGIEPAQLHTVFDMFSQLTPALARSRGGLGIGLALARALVDLHHGRIEARSDGPGRGSTFSVELPLLPVDAASEGCDTEAGAGAGAAAGPVRRSVLVADDNVDAAQTLADMLTHEGHQVRVAFGGRQALALAQQAPPEVAILDIGMPDLSGYDLCRALRALPGGDAMLVMACTGWGQPQDRERAREAGFDVHLVKPINPATVFARVLQSRSAAAAAGG
jgi:PAS domain S-box-containing protein